MWLYLSGCDPLHIAKSTLTVRECSYQEWPMNHLLRRLSGTTLKPCELSIYAGPLISPMADFPARTLAVQELEKAWQESEADYFLRSCARPKKSSPHSYSLKTCQPSQAEEAFRSLVKLPKWGMIADGVLYPLQALERYTSAKGGSYWPTPQARSQTDTPSERNRHTPCLETQVKVYATPTASQANKPIRAPSPSREKGEHGEDLQDSVGRLHPENIGKKLCARWVSSLMGYPTTWTDLEAWVIPWFLNKRKKRLKF